MTLRRVATEVVSWWVMGTLLAVGRRAIFGDSWAFVFLWGLLISGVARGAVHLDWFRRMAAKDT